MKRLLTLLILLLLATFAPAQAAWYGLGSSVPADAIVTVPASDADGLTLHVTVPGFDVTEPESGYARLTIPGEGFAGEVGAPELPTITRLVRVPFGAEIEVTGQGDFVTLPVATFSGTDRLAPVQPSIPKLPGAVEAARFVVDANAYRNATPVFDSAAASVDEGVLRAYRFVTLQIRPVNYQPAEGLVEVATDLTVTIRFHHPDWTETARQIDRYAEPRTYAMAQALMVNFNSFGDAKAARFAPSSYVMVAPAAVFANANVQALMEWKAMRGYDVVTLDPADVGGTPQSVLTYLRNAYATWDRPPAYVLILGDTNIVASFGSTSGNMPTDLYYSTITQGDYISDLGVGRLPFRTDEHIKNMVDKILTYEQAGWSGDDTWTKHATFMASTDNWNVSETTHNTVCQYFLEPAGFTCTKVFSAHGGTTQQAIAALNTGPTIHAYSGHGSETSWADGPVMNQTQVRNLTNTTTPLVLSHACVTGSYDIAECFGETWVRIPKGALAFWGASNNSYWDEDDVIEKAMFQGWFRGDGQETALPWTTGMLDYSLVKLYERYSGGGNTKYYFEMYNLLGDPEVLLFSAPPAEIDPDFPNHVLPGADQIEVSVSGKARLLVGVWADGEPCGMAYTDASGDAVVDLWNAPKGDELTLTITGQNIVPFQDVIPIGAGDDDDDDDDTTGDDDDDNGVDDDDDTIGDDDDDNGGDDDDDDDDDDDNSGCGN